MTTELVAPKRGGNHSVYGLYIGGSGLDQDYKSEDRNLYSYAAQRRNAKTISSIERDLVSARDSTATQKIDGKLEAVVPLTTEIGKERFLTLLQRRVEEQGQETFYYMKDGRGTVVNLFDHVHNFTLDAVIAEFDQQNAPDNVTHAAFDSYKKDEIMSRRLVVESLMTTDFFSKIFTRYGHRMDFKRVSGACLLIMALETCNASASLDVDEATAAFAALTLLDAFPGEKIADMMHEALRLIKIMQTAFSIPNNTGSRLLQPRRPAKNSIARSSLSLIVSRGWNTSTRC